MALFDGQTVVVTGAANGIGRALARGFMDDGATVVAADIDERGLAALAESGALIAEVDVAQAADMERMVRLAVDETGRIDALFNNAGVGPSGTIESSAAGEWERTFSVHVLGALHGMRAAIPHMRRQAHGRIVNTISRVAEFCGPGSSSYAAGKAGVWALSRCAAKEVEDSGILVNMLIPGPTNTAIWRRNMPNMQPPEAVYPTARMLASLPPDGPSGEVFWDERVYPMFAVLFDDEK